MLDFSAELAACAADVEAGLDALLSETSLAGPGVPSARLVAAMRHGALGGGKRLRPLLVRQTAAMFDVPASDSLFAGLAVELVHCYSLVHDDLPAMDDDDLRRGRPTVHKAFDEATAILAGDALLTLGFAVLAHGSADPGIRLALIAELAAGAGTGGMVGGQMRDIEGEAAGLDAPAIAAMQTMKTGALIRTAVRMGAILGGAGDKDLARLTRYGEGAGRAFQLADDILDATASPDAMGKATGKDAARNKQTIVARLSLDAARQQLAENVHHALSALTLFTDRAQGLKETALYFASREH